MTAVMEREAPALMPELPPSAPPAGPFNVTIARRDLHAALTTAGRAVSIHSSLPVLHNLLLTAQGAGLAVTATDLELAIVALAPAVVRAPGCLCLPARVLIEIVGALPEAEVALTGDARQAQLTCRGSTYTLQGLDAEDYPALSEVGGEPFALAAGLLRRLLTRVLVAASDDQTRPILTGVLWEWIAAGLTLCATDTHRLALEKEPGIPGDGTALIPGRTCRELLRLLPEGEGAIEVRLDPNQVEFRLPQATLSGNLIEGRFPRYERVIPTAAARVMTVDREALLSALRRVRIVARDAAVRERVILAAEGDALLLTAETSDLGAAREEVACALVGEPLIWACNVEFLREALAVLDTETVRFELGENPLSPFILRGAADAVGLHVLMPMQIV